MSSDMGMDGMYSLRAIESWIGIINSNLEGSSRNAYKGSAMKFKGGVAQVIRAPQGALQGIQAPETSLLADQTSIDFSQGSIINNPEMSSVAIQGFGFFCLNTLANGTGDKYYTRDGQFHLDAALNLVNAQGLFVMNNAAVPVALTVVDTTDYNPATGYNCGSVSSRVMIAWCTAGATVNQQGLKFSKYGSTIFEAGISGINGTLDHKPTGTQLYSQSVETSNTSISQTLPELSLAQKMYTAISKIISVHQTNLDTAINLIR